MLLSTWKMFTSDCGKCKVPSILLCAWCELTQLGLPPGILARRMRHLACQQVQAPLKILAHLLCRSLSPVAGGQQSEPAMLYYFSNLSSPCSLSKLCSAVNMQCNAPLAALQRPADCS